MIRADAPGKLLLLGEYAVLTGATALVMAVDRRVTVTLETGEPGASRLHAPQMHLDHAALRWHADRVECGQGADRLGMTGRLLPRLAEAFGIPPDVLAGLHITIDSGALFQAGERGPVKLGLGSSGAVSAALVRAFERLAGRPPAVPGECLAWLLPVYRTALQSDASGADLAASLAGGLSAYRLGAGTPEIVPVAWPDALHWQPIWVGKPAQTGDFVDAFRAWHGRAADHGVLSAMAEHAAHAAASTDAADWLADFDACAGLLDRLGRAIGRQILSLPHRRLRERAAECGVVYKSCGAGGGDFGIALCADPEALARFRADSRALGAYPLQLQVDRHGAIGRRDRRS